MDYLLSGHPAHRPPPRRVLVAVLGAVLLHGAVLWVSAPGLSMVGERSEASVVVVRSIVAPAAPDKALEGVVSPATRADVAADAGSLTALPAATPQMTPPAAQPASTDRGTGRPEASAVLPEAHPSASPREAFKTTAAARPPAEGPRAAPTPASSESVSTAAAAGRPGAAARGQVGLPPAPDYLSGGQLDPGPRPLEDIEPAYPENANLREGTVVLRLLVSETGALDNVAVVSADPVGFFESAALDAFSRAKFSPGRVLGIPVKSQITIEVHFMPINRGPRISGRGY